VAIFTPMTNSPKIHHVDYAVVGSGIAGLRAAIELSAAGNVLVLAKSHLSDSATAWAQGGIAVALSDEDEIGLHEQDTINAGDGLCRPEAVTLLVEEGPKYISQLIEWGTEFDRAGTKLAFTREAAHSRSRILHAQGDSTGREISRALLARAHAIPHLHLRAHAFTTELITERGRVSGLRFIDETDGTLHELHANAVLLATGGVGQIYRETTNPEVATGDGMAIAYDAGAVLSDMEFMQFHPTALAIQGAPRFLLSEALRGEGGVLRNIGLERFMKKYHEAQELAPRDIVARAIVSEMQRTQSTHVYLDMTKKSEEFLKKRFPRIYETCLSHGLDLASDLAPVCPAAHYLMGGVKTDLKGHTSLAGLYAAGETAATGVIAGQAMMKDAPAGKRTGQALLGGPAPLPDGSTGAQKDAVKDGVAAKNGATAKNGPGRAPAVVCALLTKIREVMWQDASIMRGGKELAGAIKQLEAIEPPKSDKSGRGGHELRNLHTLALVMTRTALAREESRGSHYRSDFPFRNDEDFAKHSSLQKGKDVRFEP